MGKMSEAECKSFLLNGAHTAKLGTVRKEGRPHVAPVWFDLDGDTLVFTTGRDTVKGMNILRDPRVCICVDDEKPPFAFVQVEGTATVSTDPDQLLYWATRLAGKYMGPKLADSYGRRNAVEGELLVRITPTKFYGLKDVAS